MSAQDQARALMNRHHHLVRNRQQAMLTRVAAEVGLPAEDAQVQGKLNPAIHNDYDRSHSTMS